MSAAINLVRNVDLGEVSRSLGGVRLVLKIAADGSRSLEGDVAAADLQAAVDAASDLDAAQANETTLRNQAAQALAANKTDVGTNDAYLAIASPTNAQVAAQVKELTRQSTRQARQINALIRLALRRFDATD